MFRHFCGILGHDLKHCAAHYAVRKMVEVWSINTEIFLR